MSRCLIAVARCRWWGQRAPSPGLRPGCRPQDGRPPDMITVGQRTPAELIDRFELACRPVRDLLVDYLSERQATLDYSSLRALAADLGNVFWKDLERHHPGIDSLHLPSEVAAAWSSGCAPDPRRSPPPAARRRRSPWNESVTLP